MSFHVEDRLQRRAESILARACRHLPDEVREERIKEWGAEIPAVLHESEVRPAWRRGARTAWFVLGVVWTSRAERVADPTESAQSQLSLTEIASAVALAASALSTISGSMTSLSAVVDKMAAPVLPPTVWHVKVILMVCWLRATAWALGVQGRGRRRACEADLLTAIALAVGPSCWPGTGAVDGRRRS